MDIGEPAGSDIVAPLPKKNKTLKKWMFSGKKLMQFGQNKSLECYLHITCSSG